MRLNSYNHFVGALLMKVYKISRFILSFILAFTFSPAALQAVALIDNSSDVFKFQQKLADSGNVQAQFKLGSMYEAGDGVGINIEQAKYWYGIAAEAGSQSAAQRNSFLRIKESGFDASRDTPWLNSVKGDAGQHKADAVFLLGQLYKNGIGVEKNLEKSLVLYKQIKSLGEANVEREITSINSELKDIAAARERTREKKEQIARQEENVQQAQQRDLVLQKKQAESDEQLAQAEKRKKYEAVMLQLKLERKKIRDQQADVTGNSVATADDEI